MFNLFKLNTRLLSKPLKPFPSSSPSSTATIKPIAIAHSQDPHTPRPQNPFPHEGWLFIDSVFPIRVARWDLRHYMGLLREETLLDDIQIRLRSLTAHSFTVLALHPYHKDGGVFVRFSYTAFDQPSALRAIQSQLSHLTRSGGHPPSWMGLRRGNFWIVKGTPWLEDMNHFPSPILHIAFDGPDIHQQSLYQLFRPYGHIQSLSHPQPAPPGGLRYATIIFDRIRYATIARNVLSGFNIISNPTPTYLHTAYQRPVQPHVIRDWISNHPRISFPILIFLLGSLSYMVFDPIRSLMVEAKLLDSFNFRESKLYTWLRINTIDQFARTWRSSPESALPPDHLWRERNEVAAVIRSYLADHPNTVAFVHGPQGSGETEIIDAVLKESRRTTLVIDCELLLKAPSDSRVVASLATQTGYWPVFTFLNSLNNLVDLASVGLIGQKASISSGLSDQLQQILSVVASALQGVSARHRAKIARDFARCEKEILQQEQNAQKLDRILLGTWHDGRLDCVAGNGIMSELGVGDEQMLDINGLSLPHTLERSEEDERENVRKQRTKEELEGVTSLPVVVLRNFSSKRHSEILNVLSRWAAMLVENQIAHVIVLSNNREWSKSVAKELRTKSLFTITLSDADSKSSVAYVERKLRDGDIYLTLTPQQVASIERLGGRTGELDSLIHRVRSGQPIEGAVEDIIHRGVEELRKNLFGDDSDDAKNLPWSREQAWSISRLLAKHGEVPYHTMLVEDPFNGDDTPLRNMEHAEMITVTTQDGRPSIIKPGRPILRWMFEKLVDDPAFYASQELAFNQKLVANAERTIHSCEEELATLRVIATYEHRPWWSVGLDRNSATATRMRYLSEKMLNAEKKVEALEKENKELKKVLAKGK